MQASQRTLGLVVKSTFLCSLSYIYKSKKLSYTGKGDWKDASDRESKK